MPQIKVGETVYEAAPLDSISLRDLTQFRRAMADIAPGATFSDIEAAAQEITAATEAAEKAGEAYNADSHPLYYPMLAVNLWVTLKHEGITLDDVLDMNIASFEFIPDPEDAADPQ